MSAENVFPIRPVIGPVLIVAVSPARHAGSVNVALRYKRLPHHSPYCYRAFHYEQEERRIRLL
jgi:hypothetical protein